MKEAIISFPALGLELNPPSGIDIFGFTVYLYGAVIALGVVLAVLYCSKRAPRFGLTDDNVLDVVLWAVPLGVVGARLYYVIFNFDMYAGQPLGDLLADLVNLRKGGLAIYGGIIAGSATAAMVCHVKKISIPAFLDLGSFGLLIGQMCGRWGNFFNREAYGAETELFTRMGLTTARGTIYVHPTFLYESLWNLLGFALLHSYVSRNKRKFDGEVFLLYVLWYGIGRCMIEGLRTDSLYIGDTGIRVSQLLAGLSAAVALALWAMLRRKPHTLFADRAAQATHTEEEN